MLISNNSFNIRFSFSQFTSYTSCSKFNRAFAFVVIVTIVGNPLSHLYVAGKGISILKDFSDKNGYSPPIFPPKLIIIDIKYIK